MKRNPVFRLKAIIISKQVYCNEDLSLSLSCHYATVLIDYVIGTNICHKVIIVNLS